MLTVSQTSDLRIAPDQGLSKLVAPAVEPLSLLVTPSIEQIGIRVADRRSSEHDRTNVNFSLAPLGMFRMPSLGQLFTAVEAD